ncbi:MAG: YceI family protein [Balneolaceae bacterium]
MKTIRFTIYLLFLLFSQNHVEAVSQVTSADSVYFSDSGYAEFTSDVPLHSFTGRSDHLTGLIDPGENLIDFYLDIKTLKTGIGKRDRDMYSTLHADEHPFAEFTGSLDSLSLPAPGQETTITTTGEFKINGKSKTMSVEGSLTHTEEGLRLQADFPILLSDFEIEPPGILFYRVNDKQAVEINVLLKPIARDEL